MSDGFLKFNSPNVLVTLSSSYLKFRLPYILIVDESACRLRLKIIASPFAITFTIELPK